MKEVLMRYQIVLASVCLLATGACQRSIAGPSPAAAPVSPADVKRPWKAQVSWGITAVQWAGAPGQAKSLFGGRCSVPSDYIASGAFTGEATHAGRVTGQTEHCSQITWSAQGQPIGVTYGDGAGSLVAADGSRLSMRYGNGVTGFDAETGETWFTDDFTFTGGTGRFEGAAGGGKEGGRFIDFTALLGGAPLPMWMEGTITYSPGR
jgi:hypothetical protein